MPLVLRVFASGFRMYQSETSSMPSGLACAARMITSRRMRVVSSSVLLANW